MVRQSGLTLLGLGLIQLLAVQSFASHEIGNGGGAWFCANPDSAGTTRWAQLVDLYEAREEFKLTVLNVANLDYQQIADQVMQERLLPANEDLHRSVKAELEAVRAGIVPVTAKLETVDDALFRIRPEEKECPGGTISYVQLANYTNYGKVLLQKARFEDRKLSETSKAALWVHEAVYASLRDRYGDKTSVRARRIVGLLFSTIPTHELKAELETLLLGDQRPLGMEFVRIRAGSFMMGAPKSEKGRSPEETQHWVQLAADFEMQTTHVTQQQYFDLMGVNPSNFKNVENCPETFKIVQGASGFTSLCPNHPVERVSWNDAQEFVAKLNASKKDRYVYRLPTEAEWEFAARAGTSTAYSFGNDPGKLPLYSCFHGTCKTQTREVGQFKPNAFGLFDMHGNAWQWVQDPFVWASGVSGGVERVVRGGSYGSYAEEVRSAFRIGTAPESRFDTLGFRLARSK